MASKADQVREYVRENGGRDSVTGSEVADAVGCTTDTVYRAWQDVPAVVDGEEESGDLDGEPEEVEEPEESADPDAGDLDPPEEEPDEEVEEESDDLDGENRDVDDDLADDGESKEYACGNCGHGLDYLGGEDRDGGGKKCPECGERLFWSKV